MRDQHDFTECTDEEFDTILSDIMDEEKGSSFLSIPGIYELVAEHFNNEILDRWGSAHP